MIIAAFNPKGGVGKTTTAVNLAAALANRSRSVLLVDLEADMNASISVGVQPGDAHPSIADLLLHEQRPSDAVRPVARIPHLYVVSGAPELAYMDVALRHVRDAERHIANVLQPLVKSFDVVVLDAPAGFSFLALGAFRAAEQLIVPVRPDYLSLESLAHFLRWYGDRHRSRKSWARLAGILLTMVDYRRQATREIVDIIRRHNPHGVFRTEIPADPRVAEAPSHGIPLVAYARSKASVAYRQLAREMLRRMQRASR